VLPNLDVKIADDGEVLVRGPSVMKGYYNNPEATAEDFDGDWYKTGDIGELDEEGYLKIIDRKKRIIVLSTGKNVAPQPIENAINESVYIGHSIVFGEKQKYIICLVNPDFENLLPWAERRGITAESTEELCRNHQVKALIESEVERLTAHFADFEKPKKVVIIGKEWTVDGGELTPKLSLRLQVIEAKYKQLIQETYGKDFVDEEKEIETAGEGQGKQYESKARIGQRLFRRNGPRSLPLLFVLCNGRFYYQPYRSVNRNKRYIGYGCYNTCLDDQK